MLGAAIKSKNMVNLSELEMKENKRVLYCFEDNLFQHYAKKEMKLMLTLDAIMSDANKFEQEIAITSL